jgi:hypothetical protein
LASEKKMQARALARPPVRQNGVKIIQRSQGHGRRAFWRECHPDHASQIPKVFWFFF